MYRWLGKRDTMEIMLEGSITDPRPPLHNYTVTVVTSDIRNAGADADVFIDIKGKARLLGIICFSLQQPHWRNKQCANMTGRSCTWTTMPSRAQCSAVS